MTEDKGLHLAIIPDGNRRWASQRNLKPWEGHAQGLEAFRALLRWAHADQRIAVITIWGFSTENWQRNNTEVRQLMRLFEDFLTKERQEFHQNKSRFVHAGRKDRIPKSLARLIAEVEEETALYDRFTVQFALDYGGRDELVRAVQRMGDSGKKKVTEAALRSNLDHPEIPDIDLIVRTSGEQRLSNFFLWHGAYAELAFTNKHFPELTPAKLDAIVSSFAARDRRFGK